MPEHLRQGSQGLRIRPQLERKMDSSAKSKLTVGNSAYDLTQSNEVSSKSTRGVPGYRQRMHASEPPHHRVLTAFGVSPPVECLVGGQGTTWRADDVILKPLDMLPEAVHWQADIMQPLSGRDDLRLTAPRCAKDGSLIIDGWTAWDRLSGTSDHAGRWDDIIAVGDCFCELTRNVPRPAFLDSRQDPWAMADRIAWGERSAESVRHVPFVATLLGVLETVLPIQEPSQIVHGDLTGNVLFSPNSPPALIDISPYWRPRSYGTAIVLVDALTWEEAPLDWARGHLLESAQQHAFLRALLFRILSDHFRTPIKSISANYECPVELITKLISQIT